MGNLGREDDVVLVLYGKVTWGPARPSGSKSPRSVSFFWPCLEVKTEQSLSFHICGNNANPLCQRSPQPLRSNAWWSEVGADVIIIEIKCTINVTLYIWSIPKPLPLPQPVRGKVVFHKTSPWCQQDWGLLFSVTKDASAWITKYIDVWNWKQRIYFKKYYCHHAGIGGVSLGRRLRSLLWHRRNKEEGLPWWLNDKEPTCQGRRHGFGPWTGKIPHVVEQLSLCATTIEPVP